ELASDGAQVGALIPPVRGVEFFAQTEMQPQLDAWWESQIPSHADVIFLLDDRDDLADWLIGLDGACYVGVASMDRMGAYEQRPGLRVFGSRAPLDYAPAVMSDLVVEGTYDEVEANRMLALAVAFTDGAKSLPASAAAAEGGVIESGP